MNKKRDIVMNLLETYPKVWDNINKKDRVAARKSYRDILEAAKGFGIRIPQAYPDGLPISLSSKPELSIVQNEVA